MAEFISHWPVMYCHMKQTHTARHCVVRTTRTTTTIVLWQLYRSTCISRHLKLRTGGFCWCKFYCPHALAGGNQHIQITKKTLEFSSTVLSTLSQYLKYYTISQKKQDTKLMPITSPNVNRFLKFFRWQTHW